MADLVVILVLSVLGLAAHGARSQPWIQWTLRVIYGFACVAELYTVFSYYPTRADSASPWAQAVTLVMAVLTGIMLFKPVRQGLSYVFTGVDFLVGGQMIAAIIGKQPLKERFQSSRIFIAESMPHLNGLWIYVTTICSLLANISPESWNMPMIGIPFPVPIDSLFSYNLFGLVILAACGAGIFVARKPGEVLRRLGIVKPEPWHYGVAFFTLIGTFVYDYVWSLYTGTPQAGIGVKLGQYNTGTFSAGGGAGPAALLSVATAICAGIGEETLMRGGLQPVFGIVPAGALHGILHGQFNHMPLLMIQIGIWSCGLGVVRKYTNTTTTIIAHGAYNLINTFLFAFNP
ncbi:MAG TPA: CPBP family intramembrane glutamic endopeptidase [Candidatus Obscuribacterales bacterium]